MRCLESRIWEWVMAGFALLLVDTIERVCGGDGRSALVSGVGSFG
jgi:hypothetical protein